VAGYDEDSTTLAVAAALPVVQGREPTAGSVWFATTDPVYADKTNATAVHAALDLQPGILAADLGATVRSGIVALLAAARDGGLAVLADRRGGPVGGTDEREGADAAAAFLFGERDPLARIVGTASVTAEFIGGVRPGRRTARPGRNVSASSDTPSSPASCWPGSPTLASSSAASGGWPWPG